jgi:hypothetical protein
MHGTVGSLRQLHLNTARKIYFPFLVAFCAPDVWGRFYFDPIDSCFDILNKSCKGEQRDQSAFSFRFFYTDSRGMYYGMDVNANHVLSGRLCWIFLLMDACSVPYYATGDRID